jgi:hypothetical protein
MFRRRDCCFSHTPHTTHTRGASITFSYLGRNELFGHRGRNTPKIYIARASPGHQTMLSRTSKIGRLFLLFTRLQPTNNSTELRHQGSRLFIHRHPHPHPGCDPHYVSLRCSYHSSPLPPGSSSTYLMLLSPTRGTYPSRLQGCARGPL